MNRRSASRLAVPVAAVLLLGGCSGVQNDGQMFQRWAADVAAIQVTADDGQAAAPTNRPAALSETPTPMQAGRGLAIQVVDSLDLPEAQALGLRAVLQTSDAPVPTTPSGLRGLIKVADEIAATDKPTAGAVQLAAFPNAKAAEAAWSKLQAAHPEILGRVKVRYEKADLGAKGVWVRLKAPVSSAEQARLVCQAAGAGKWCAGAFKA